jgi:single-strand DNA-binding protein
VATVAGETVITIIGNLTADPELRFTPSGDAVANFTVASTPRSFDRQAQEWRDGEALFMRCNVWRQQGENVAEGLRRGDRVVVVGRLKQRSYEKDGQKRTVIELEADEVAASARWALVSAQKAERRTSARSGGRQAEDPWGRADDPWSSAGPARSGFGSGQQDGAPF